MDDKTAQASVAGELQRQLDKCKAHCRELRARLRRVQEALFGDRSRSGDWDDSFPGPIDDKAAPK